MQQSEGKTTQGKSSTNKGPRAGMRNEDASVFRAQGAGEKVGEEMKEVAGSPVMWSLCGVKSGP